MMAILTFNQMFVIIFFSNKMCTIEWTALKIFSIFLKKTKSSESHLGTDQGAHLPICIFADES